MTMHAEELVGAQVTDSHGLAVGTVEQVFRDDVDGTPTWARISSDEGLRLVPLAGCSVTSSGGLSVPFDSEKIMQEPPISAERHISVDQEDELRRYFGLSVPAQSKGEAETLETQAPEPVRDQAEPAPAQAEPAAAQAEPATAQMQEPGTDQDWLIRSEERIDVGLETRETARVRLHKYVDTEPIDQTVHVFHEEYEIERIPVSKDDQVSGDMGESEQEVILHEGRAVVSKHAVPVERVRLSVRRVEEDKPVSGDIRKERIEIDSTGSESAPYSDEMGGDFGR
jgi:uncharacterized protein (TIGR02271 family)